VQNEAGPLKELEIISAQINNEDDWSTENDGINRVIALINGGILQFNCVVRDLKPFASSLVSASRDMRRTLIMKATLLLSQLAHQLGDRFEGIGEVVLPLSSQTSRGAQVIANSCRYAILDIIYHCQTKRILKSVAELDNSRSAANRRIFAEFVNTAVNQWRKSMVDADVGKLSGFLAKLTTDAQSEAREIARETLRLFGDLCPERAIAARLPTAVNDHEKSPARKWRSLLPTDGPHSCRWLGRAIPSVSSLRARQVCHDAAQNRC
jgi:hypothetical protein